MFRVLSCPETAPHKEARQPQQQHTCSGIDHCSGDVCTNWPTSVGSRGKFPNTGASVTRPRGDQNALVVQSVSGHMLRSSPYRSRMTPKTLGYWRQNPVEIVFFVCVCVCARARTLLKGVLQARQPPQKKSRQEAGRRPGKRSTHYHAYTAPRTRTHTKKNTAPHLSCPTRPPCPRACGSRPTGRRG